MDRKAALEQTLREQILTILARTLENVDDRRTVCRQDVQQMRDRPRLITNTSPANRTQDRNAPSLEYGAHRVREKQTGIGKRDRSEGPRLATTSADLVFHRARRVMQNRLAFTGLGSIDNLNERIRRLNRHACRRPKGRTGMKRDVHAVVIEVQSADRRGVPLVERMVW